MRRLVPEEDGPDVGTYQRRGAAGKKIQQRIHVQLTRDLLADGLHGLELSGATCQRLLRRLALAQLPLGGVEELGILDGDGGLRGE